MCGGSFGVSVRPTQLFINICYWKICAGTKVSETEFKVKDQIFLRNFQYCLCRIAGVSLALGVIWCQCNHRPGLYTCMKPQANLRLGLLSIRLVACSVQEELPQCPD